MCRQVQQSMNTFVRHVYFASLCYPSFHYLFQYSCSVMHSLNLARQKNLLKDNMIILEIENWCRCIFTQLPWLLLHSFMYRQWNQGISNRTQNSNFCYQMTTQRREFMCVQTMQWPCRHTTICGFYIYLIHFLSFY